MERKIESFKNNYVEGVGNISIKMYEKNEYLTFSIILWNRDKKTKTYINLFSFNRAIKEKVKSFNLQKGDSIAFEGKLRSYLQNKRLSNSIEISNIRFVPKNEIPKEFLEENKKNNK